MRAEREKTPIDTSRTVRLPTRFCRCPHINARTPGTIRGARRRGHAPYLPTKTRSARTPLALRYGGVGSPGPGGGDPYGKDAFRFPYELSVSGAGVGSSRAPSPRSAGWAISPVPSFTTSSTSRSWVSPGLRSTSRGSWPFPSNCTMCSVGGSLPASRPRGLPSWM